jgi:hypothetical protein
MSLRDFFRNFSEIAKDFLFDLGISFALKVSQSLQFAETAIRRVLILLEGYRPSKQFELIEGRWTDERG